MAKKPTAYQIQLTLWVETLNRAKRHFTSEAVIEFLDRLIQICLDRYDEESKKQ